MVYQPNIPLSTDQISTSQGDILGNFQALDPFINGVFNFPVQGSAPAPTGNNILYALNFAPTGLNEIFVQNAAGTLNTPMTAKLATGVTGWTYFPSGAKLIWGQSTITSGNSTTPVSFLIAGFTAFTSPTSISIQLTRVHNTTSTNFIQVDSYNASGFIARRSTSTTSSSDLFMWLAIGI